MTYALRVEQLCNLVNARRIRVGKEPLRMVHIGRAIRLMCGRPETGRHPEFPKRRYAKADGPVPFTVTPKGLWALSIEKDLLP